MNDAQEFRGFPRLRVLGGFDRRFFLGGLRQVREQLADSLQYRLVPIGLEVGHTRLAPVNVGPAPSSSKVTFSFVTELDDLGAGNKHILEPRLIRTKSVRAGL